VNGQAQSFIWADTLLRATAELRAQAGPDGDLDAEAAGDLNGTLNAASAVESALRATCPTDLHALRNDLGALQGYAEMLSESLDASRHGALRACLGRLLQATYAAQDTSLDSSPDLATAPVSREPGRILAIDDRAENRELVARYLIRCGHTVITAASGEEALSILEGEDVDVVLLDLLMPVMDGHEVLGVIKSHPEWRATPVIVISGHQDMQGIIRCIEAGAEDYLFKPFNPVLLQARIKAGIERKRWHDREEQYRRQLERNERFIRATFGRYLSDEIVTDILERPEGLELGGDLREVTIMMSDIRGFTTLCEQLAPAEVVRMLNRYLGAMTDIILNHQGTIDEFIGDAILAVFGAPHARPDDADRAVRCALAMQAAMRDINAANAAEGLPQLNTAIALNTGSVIAGNIGSERRSKYGFVGHPMNVTSRIEDITAGGEILLAQSTRDALQDRYRFEEPRQIRMRGIDEPLQVFRVRGAEGDREA